TTQLNRRTIHPISRSRSAKKKSLTSAWRRSTSSTKRARLRPRTATSSSPAAAAAVVVAVAVVAADVVAVAADAAAALAGSAAAALPGAHVAGAKRGYLPRVNDTNNQGRVRHCRPGLCMCGVVRSAYGLLALSDTPNSRFSKRHPQARQTSPAHSRGGFDIRFEAGPHKRMSNPTRTRRLDLLVF